MPDKTIAQRVAEACGLETDVVDPWSGHSIEFDPHRDANDTLLAAEKFGLFHAGNCELHGLILSGGVHGWAVWQGDEMIGSGTFCEAICPAILAGEKGEPLKKKTMTLNQLQMRTLDALRHVRFQLQRLGHEPGMSDDEFIEEFIDPLATDIYKDRQVLKMKRKRKGSSDGP